MSDDLTERREADALRVWKAEGKAPAGICPHCGSTISVVQRDGWFRARCAHRGCGASGPRMLKLTRAVETFCRPDAYVLRHMGVHRSSLTDVVTHLEADRDEWRTQHDNAVACWRRDVTVLVEQRDKARAEVARLRGLLAEACELVPLVEAERLRAEARREP